MSPSDQESLDDVVLEDAPQSAGDTASNSAALSHSTATDNADNPKSKRIACVLCRKRKLRCDGQRPACGTCKRLAHDCAYDEVRRKSGPKRGYVKQLESRLRQVETLLKSQEHTDQTQDATQAGVASIAPQPNSPPLQMGSLGGAMDDFATLVGVAVPSSSSPFPITQNTDNGIEQQFSWEMIGLGLEEPLPPQETIDDLNRLYFEKVHPSFPMIHRPRYHAAMNLAPNMRPPICLRYAMWAVAASLSERYDRFQAIAYQRARKYAEIDEMKGHGESMITIAHCQTWILITVYEFKHMYFPRAWQSTGRAVRAAQMMGLHRLDGAGLDVKQCLPPPRDWTEKEERRRTFWMAFSNDRYASIGTGWPMTVEEKDIMTNLPATEEAFEKSKPMQMSTLAHAMEPGGAATLTPTGGVILMACLFGRNLTHLHRPGLEDRDHDLDGGFWRRHRDIESILSNTSLAMPDLLRLPEGLGDPNVVFTNMTLHTSAICLHQAAIFKADKHRLPANIGSESRVRCVTAAAEIARIMRMISHTDLSAMNPFISFCLYVASRVFVQYLKFRPKDQQMTASLQFLMSAMNTIKRKNPLTESFLVQLDLDLEGTGAAIDVPRLDPTRLASVVSQDPCFDDRGPRPYLRMQSEVPQAAPGVDNLRCSPLFEIREHQSMSDGPSGSTFANQGISAHNTPGSGSQPPLRPDSISPGPPFHTSRANINLDVDSTAYGFVPAGNHLQAVHLTSRPKSTTAGSGSAITESPQSDMDLTPDHTSPSTSNRGTSSHTSFTPDQHIPSPNLDIPNFSNTATKAQTAPTTSQVSGNYIFSSNDDFAAFNTGLFPATPSADPLGAGGFGVQAWDSTGGIDGMMGEAGWNAMLDGMQGMQGWDFGAGHVFGSPSEFANVSEKQES